MGILKKLVKRKKQSSDEVLQELRNQGAKIGKDVKIFSTALTLIDKTAPWLITIGDYVQIAEGVKILTHDYAWSVLKHYGPEPGAIIGAQSPVKIGNSVFIGMNAVITRGVTIGDYVIIGAGSVVTKDCPSSGVYAGNPAKLIMTMEQYRQKRLSCQFSDAKLLALQYRERFGKMPPQEIFSEYFFLFADYETAKDVPAFYRQMQLLGNLEETKQYMQNHPPRYAGYAAFLKACLEDGEEK